MIAKNGTRFPHFIPGFLSVCLKNVLQFLTKESDFVFFRF